MQKNNNVGKEVWWEVKPKDQKAFFEWLKESGCVWVDGKEIDPNEKVEFIHFAVSNDKKISIIPAFTWVDKNLSKEIEKHCFKSSITTNLLKRKKD